MYKLINTAHIFKHPGKYLLYHYTTNTTCMSQDLSDLVRFQNITWSEDWKNITIVLSDCCSWMTGAEPKTVSMCCVIWDAFLFGMIVKSGYLSYLILHVSSDLSFGMSKWMLALLFIHIRSGFSNLEYSKEICIFWPFSLGSHLNSNIPVLHSKLWGQNQPK